MEDFLTAIENHPKACAFLLLLAILTCTFRFYWFVGKGPDEASDKIESQGFLTKKVEN